MASAPDLNDPKVISVLETLLRSSGIRGGALMKETGLPPTDELSKAVQFLRDQELIQVSGDISKENLPFATLGVLPSQIERIHLLLKQARSKAL
jgi:hypothetical protein